MPGCSVGIYGFGPLWALEMPARRKPHTPAVGDTMTAQEMTQYAVRHQLRNAWGVMDEQEIKQTISFAAEYWRLEMIGLSPFPHEADPKYRNRSTKAHPIVLHLGDDPSGKPRYEILDGRFRVAMAKARGDRT